jgi:hypothetical protein
MLKDEDYSINTSYLEETKLSGTNFGGLGVPLRAASVRVPPDGGA